MPLHDAFFVSSDQDLREINAATIGGFVGGGWRCAGCRRDWGTLDGEDRCRFCGGVYQEEKPPAETLLAVIGGGVQKVKKALRPAPDKPAPLAEDLAPAVWLRDALRNVLEALPAGDEALGRLKGQGDASERRWGRARAMVQAATPQGGDFYPLLGRCPVRGQLEQLRIAMVGRAR